MTKYRFKTEGEFIREFGPDWRHRVACSFPRTMDFLLGMPRHTEGAGNWAVSGDMLTPILANEVIIDSVSYSKV